MLIIILLLTYFQIILKEHEIRILPVTSLYFTNINSKYLIYTITTYYYYNSILLGHSS